MMIKRIAKNIFASDITTICLIIILFSTAYSFIGFQKHNHFQTFAWDTAIFDQQLFLVSQLKLPISSLHGFIGLGDHFHPLFYIIGGLLYKVWSKAEMLYVLQASLASLSMFPLYLITKKILHKTYLSGLQIRLLSLLICTAYLLNVSFQFMVLGEYNDASSVALPLLFAIYFLLTKNDLGFWVSFTALLLTKEEYTLLAVPLAIFIIISKRQIKKAALVLFLGLGTFFLLTYLVMPALAMKKEYIFFTNSNRPSEIFIKMLQRPHFFITKLIDHPKKRETIFVSLSSFGFLPLLSPTNLILPVANLGIRFYDDSLPRRYEFNNHYAAGLIPPMAAAESFGIFNLIIFFQKKGIDKGKLFKVLFLFLFFTTLAQDFLFHGPLNSLFKKNFYENPVWVQDTHDLIKQVPSEVTVAANNSLLPHLSQRENFYLLPKIGNAEYIAVDLEDGPNKFAPVTEKDIEILIQNLINQKKYIVIWQKNKTLLLKKT